MGREVSSALGAQAETEARVIRAIAVALLYHAALVALIVVLVALATWACDR